MIFISEIRVAYNAEYSPEGWSAVVDGDDLQTEGHAQPQEHRHRVGGHVRVTDLQHEVRSIIVMK